MNPNSGNFAQSEFPNALLKEPRYDTCGVCDQQRKLTRRDTTTGLEFCEDCLPGMRSAYSFLSANMPKIGLDHPLPSVK